MWCALVGGADLVGHSSLFNAHFGQSACSGLWLLSTNHVASGSLGAFPNLATTIIDNHFDGPQEAAYSSVSKISHYQ